MSAQLVASDLQSSLFCQLSGPDLITTALLRETNPQECWLWMEHGRAQARCSLWWKETPRAETPPPGWHWDQPPQLGVIGHYAASDHNSAVALLKYGMQRLRAAGCQLAVGPLDGSTWRRYRLVTQREVRPQSKAHRQDPLIGEPPFFLEPDNPSAYPVHWEAAGFRPFCLYHSSLTEDLSWRDPRVERVRNRLTQRGVQLRMLREDQTEFERDLRAIYRMSLSSFGTALLSAPLGEEAFLQLYRPLRRYLLPTLVWLAHQEDKLVGYIFALPDWKEVQRTGHQKTLVVKTLACRPGRELAGLGAWLLDHIHHQAYSLGFRRAIHALMSQQSLSCQLSARFGQVFRRYTLFAQELCR